MILIHALPVCGGILSAINPACIKIGLYVGTKFTDSLISAVSKQLQSIDDTGRASHKHSKNSGVKT
jgi:hypothetical protein